MWTVRLFYLPPPTPPPTHTHTINDEEYIRPDVVRAFADDLTSSAWWEKLDIDAVAIVTWGFAKDTEVIRAARDAGITVFLVADDGGGSIPNVISLFNTTWRRLYHCSLIRKIVESIFKTPLLYLYFKYLYKGNCRYRQYALAHYVQVYSPMVAEKITKGIKSLKTVKQLPKIGLGYPVQCSASDDEEKKSPSVIAVAKWNAFKHKRPHYLMDVCRELLILHHEVQIHIYGKTAPFMEQIRNEMGLECAKRLHIHGFTKQDEILHQMMHSQVFFCPSASDAGPVPVGEALCCGCSVSGGGGMVAWAVREGFGTAGPLNDDPRKGAEAIIKELNYWKEGHYDSKAIAAFWRERLDSVYIAKRMVEFAQRKLSGDGIV